MNVIGMDPSLTAFGWVVVEWNSMAPIASGVISSPTAPGLGVAATAILRVGEIAKPLHEICKEHNVIGGIAEIAYAGKDHNALLSFGRMQGIVGSLPLSLIIGVTPQDVKKVSVGMPQEKISNVFIRLKTKPNMKKDHVIARVAMEWPGIYEAGNNKRYRVEAIADAYAVLLAGRQEYDIRLANPMDIRSQLKNYKTKTLTQRNLL